MKLRRTPRTKLYFEAHVTIEPVYDDRLDRVTEIARTYGFRVADLLMKKRATDTPTRSTCDTFTTGRSTSYKALHARTIALVAALTTSGYDVWRYKIENTLIDVRLKPPTIHVEITADASGALDALRSCSARCSSVRAGRPLHDA